MAKLTEDEFIDMFGDSYGYLRLLMLRGTDEFKRLKRNFEESLEKKEKWEAQRREEKRKEREREQERTTMMKTCTDCGTKYRGSRSGGSCLCPKCEHEFYKKNIWSGNRD